MVRAFSVGECCCGECTCPSVGINDVTILEPGVDTADAVFTVSLSCSPVDYDVVVEYETEDGSAVAGEDYTATSGNVTIAAGQATAKVTVEVLADALAECSETFNVNLTSVSGGCATLGDEQGVGTITDCQFTIDDVTVCECVDDEAVFTVTMNCPTAQATARTIAYETEDGTATAGADYTAVSGTLTFAAGETTKAITVPILTDSDEEGDEDFLVTLLGDCGDQGTCTIREMTLSINDIQVTEPDSGTVNAVFTVTLSPCASDGNITVQFATADGTATAGADYTSTSGTLTIANGQTTGQITVLVKGDTLGEGDENFFVNLSNSGPDGCPIIEDDQGECTILDDCDTTFRTNADTTACANQLYQYQPLVIDGPGNPLTYDLTVFPPGMTIDEDTGLVEWNPTSLHLGDWPVTIEVTGGCISPITQNYTLQVLNC